MVSRSVVSIKNSTQFNWTSGLVMKLVRSSVQLTLQTSSSYLSVRDIETRHGSLANGLLAARALLARHGFPVNTGAQPGAAPAAAPAPAPPPHPTPGPRGTCDYCGGRRHTSKTCFKKKRDLQSQIDAIDAATPDHIKSSHRPPRAKRDSANKPSDAGSQRQTALFAAAVPAPVTTRSPTPGPQRPVALPAPVPRDVAEFFEKNTVPSNKFWGLPDSSDDSS